MNYIGEKRKKIMAGIRSMTSRKPFTDNYNKYYLESESESPATESAKPESFIKELIDPVDGNPRQVDLGNEATIKFAAVKAGEYWRGSKRRLSGEKPLHKVVITHSFWISKFPITQWQYQQVMNSNPSHFHGADLPVEMVSWYEAKEFCRQLTSTEEKAGRLPGNYVYRLPTEGEWEYAARGGAQGQNYKYAGGNHIDQVAWYGGGMGGNSNFNTHPVGLKEPNELGLYDMSGNVWEWCQDWQQSYYKTGRLINPAGPESGSHRTLRGGSWGYNRNCCLITRRDGLTSSHRYCDVGFRIVLAPSLDFFTLTETVSK